MKLQMNPPKGRQCSMLHKLLLSGYNFASLLWFFMKAGVKVRLVGVGSLFYRCEKYWDNFLKLP